MTIKKKGLVSIEISPFFYLLCPGAKFLALCCPAIFFACPGGILLEFLAVDMATPLCVTTQFERENANTAIRSVSAILEFFISFIFIVFNSGKYTVLEGISFLGRDAKVQFNVMSARIAYDFVGFKKR